MTLPGLSPDVPSGLRALLNQWRPMLENIPATVIITDTKCRIHYLNIETTAMSLRQLKGRYLWDLVPFEDAVRLRSLIDRVRGGEIVNYEMTGPGEGGSRAVYAYTVGPLKYDDEAVGFVMFCRDVTAERGLAATMHTFFLTAPVGMMILNAFGHVLQSNLAAQGLVCRSEQDLQDKNILEFTDEKDAAGAQKLLADLAEDRLEQGEVNAQLRRSDGSTVSTHIFAAAVRDLNSQLHEIHILIEDCTEKNLRDQQLVQAQKLEAIGQLAAGIAHEINTPLQYTGDLLEFVRTAANDLTPVLTGVRTLCAARESASAEDLRAAVYQLAEQAEAADFEFTLENLASSIDKAMKGLEQVTQIVRAMKAFSHPGKDEKAPSDINEAIRCTVQVSRGQWKSVAEVLLNLAPDLPFVVAHESQLNQVFLNLIVNAAQAIEEVADQRGGLGTITITTRARKDMVEVVVADNGPGISDKNKARVFEHFFTTKEVGRGTGQGLPVCYDVVVNGHGGQIFFESIVGEGTQFFVQLPIKGAA